MGQDGTEVAVEAVDEPAAGGAEQRPEAAPGHVRLAPAQPWCGACALASARFAAGVVGAKSLNTQALQARGKARMQWAAASGALSPGVSVTHTLLAGQPTSAELLGGKKRFLRRRAM